MEMAGITLHKHLQSKSEGDKGRAAAQRNENCGRGTVWEVVPSIKWLSTANTNPEQTEWLRLNRKSFCRNSLHLPLKYQVGSCLIVSHSILRRAQKSPGPVLFGTLRGRGCRFSRDPPHQLATESHKDQAENLPALPQLSCLENAWATHSYRKAAVKGKLSRSW